MKRNQFKRLHRGIALPLGLAVLLAAVPALAGDPAQPDDAGKTDPGSYLKKGREAYEAGEFETAVKACRAAADSPEAQYLLGECYIKGKGVKADPAEAVKWYRLAADQGLDEAQYNLGVAYLEGSGVEKDRVEAAKWFRMAADQGMEDAAKMMKMNGLAT